MSKKLKAVTLDGGESIHITEVSHDERADFVLMVDILRRNMLFQTPVGIWSPGTDTALDPDYVGVRMRPHAYRRLMELVAKHPGWTPPEDARKALLDGEADMLDGNDDV